MSSPLKVPVTIDGVITHVDQGINSFQNLVAVSLKHGAANPPIVKITINSAAAAQNTVIGGNQSYVISGGEVLTTS